MRVLTLSLEAQAVEEHSTTVDITDDAETTSVVELESVASCLMCGDEVLLVMEDPVFTIGEYFPMISVSSRGRYSLEGELELLDPATASQLQFFSSNSWLLSDVNELLLFPVSS